MSSLVDRYRLDKPRRALILVVGVALVLRLFGLGVRVAHWDEGRVGYWILRTAATGHWEYRPIIHGPFVQHVTRWLFELDGATDFTMRLPVALIGSFLPLSALLFRTRLRDRETIALGVVLALNPLLLYYSRFMRSDLPVATFAFVALGALVTAVDTDRCYYLHLAGVAFALALTAKENAILYPVSWIGAGTLLSGAWVLDQYRQGRAPIEQVGTVVRAARERLTAWRVTLLVVALEIIAILVFFYAPRSPSPDAGLWSALANPTLLPSLIVEATVGSATAVAESWFAPSMRAHPYVPYLAHLLIVLAVASLATVILAVLAVRWRRRPLVSFGGWWALSGVVGYAYVADIKAPWLAVHVVIALAIPAAVGLVAVVERYRSARMDGRKLAALGLATLLVGSGAFVATSTAVTTYQQPPHELNIVAQGAQPGGDLRPIVEDLQTVAQNNDGTDVLYYGDLAVWNESANDQPPVSSNWFDRLPLPWYTEASGATVASAQDLESFPADPPPIVVANGSDREVLADRLPGYTVREEAIVLRPKPMTVGAFCVEKRLDGWTFVFFVDESAVRADVR